MKKRALKVTPSVYTGLFNSCANSPWPNDGLKRANHLRQLMFEKGYEPNASNYHAMIKGLSTGHIISNLWTLTCSVSFRCVVHWNVPHLYNSFHFSIWKVWGPVNCIHSSGWDGRKEGSYFRWNFQFPVAGVYYRQRSGVQACFVGKYQLKIFSFSFLMSCDLYM